MPIIPFAAVCRLHFYREWDFSDPRARVKCDPQQKPKHTTVERRKIAMCSENSRNHCSDSRRSCHANTSYWSKVSDLDHLDIFIGSFLDHSSIFKEKRRLSTGMLEIFCNTILDLHRNIHNGDFQCGTASQHCRENFRITASSNDVLKFSFMNFEIIIFIFSFVWLTVQSPRLLLALVCTRVLLPHRFY